MNTGKLYLVGIGPGDAGHLTPAAVAAIADSDELVGYHYYIEQVAGSASGQDACTAWSWGRSWSGRR